MALFTDDKFGLPKVEENFTLAERENFPEDRAFSRIERSNGRALSQMDKIKIIKDKVEHAHHFFNASLYYVPSEDNPEIKDCYAITPQMMELWDMIEEKVKDEELKNFLRIRFSQLIEIDFKKTADFFVNCSNNDIKEIFERLALVVVDYERAIMNGMFDIADTINEAGEFCIHGSYFQKRNEHMLKKNQKEDTVDDLDDLEDSE